MFTEYLFQEMVAWISYSYLPIINSLTLSKDTMRILWFSSLQHALLVENVVRAKLQR